MDENPIKYTYYWLRNKYYSWRGEIARYKYRIMCKLGYHITHDHRRSYKQNWNNGSPRHVLTNSKWVPIMNCRRCGKRVNVGLEEEYFSGKKFPS